MYYEKSVETNIHKPKYILKNWKLYRFWRFHRLWDRCNIGWKLEFLQWCLF